MNQMKVSCPNCHSALFRGPLGFGPATVQCAGCRSVISTGLTKWEDLGFFGKVGNVLKELLAPSFLFNLDSFSIRLLLGVPTYYALFALPLSLPFLIVVKDPAALDPSRFGHKLLAGLAIVGLCLYPIYIVYRLAKLIAHSYKSNNPDDLPKW